jgi:hypothetical protein
MTNAQWSKGTARKSPGASDDCGGAQVLSEHE